MRNASECWFAGRPCAESIKACPAVLFKAQAWMSQNHDLGPTASHAAITKALHLSQPCGSQRLPSAEPQLRAFHGSFEATPVRQGLSETAGVGTFGGSVGSPVRSVRSLRS